MPAAQRLASIRSSAAAARQEPIRQRKTRGIGDAAEATAGVHREGLLRSNCGTARSLGIRPARSDAHQLTPRFHAFDWSVRDTRDAS